MATQGMQRRFGLIGFFYFIDYLNRYIVKLLRTMELP